MAVRQSGCHARIACRAKGELTVIGEGTNDARNGWSWRR
jgi:hypothetical protein